MTRVALLALFVIALLVAPSATAQIYDEEEDQPAKRHEPYPDGPWPTQKMMELVIDRFTEEVGHSLNLDEDQLYNMREIYKERVPTWLNDNRAAVQTVFNQYLETLLERDAPDPLDVADWATRAKPLLEEFSGLISDTVVDMEPYLTEEQQLMYEAQMASFQSATGYLSHRLEGWSEGNFDAETEWHRSPNFGAAESQRLHDYHNQQAQARGEVLGYDEQAAGGAGPVGQQPKTEPRTANPKVAAAADEYARYVESFIRRYQLNEDQQAQAAKYLTMAQEGRDKYLRRSGDRLAAARARVQAATDERTRAAAQQACAQLERPLKRYFQQLKDRLNKLPTSAQRLAAGQRGLDRDDAAVEKASGP
ncbi:MAG: hypothetical protein PVJ57_00385 [Phycisphaerae bacterium]|jgi:hypothetical protein